MRISTAWGQHTTLSAMLNQQARLNYTQQQLASGIKNITPSDDPVVAKKVLDLNQGIERTEQYMRNVSVVESRNTLEETVLDSAQELYYRAQEITIAARNAPLSDADLQSFKKDIDMIIDNLASLANTRGPNGEYIFSGDLSKTEPVVYNPVTQPYDYEGGINQRKIAIDVTNQVADGELASNVFFGIDSVSEAVIATDDGKRSIFDTLKALSSALSGKYEVPKATLTGDAFLKYGADYSAGAVSFDLEANATPATVPATTTGVVSINIAAANYTNIKDLVVGINASALAGKVEAHVEGNYIEFDSLTEGENSYIKISDDSDGVLTSFGFSDPQDEQSINIGASMTSKNPLASDYSTSPEQFQLVGPAGQTVGITLNADYVTAQGVVDEINIQIAAGHDGVMGASLGSSDRLELHSISTGGASSIQINSIYGRFLRDTGFEEGETARLFDSVSGDILDDLGAALDKLINAKSDVGGRVKILNNQTSQHEDFILNMQTVLSDIQDLDYAEAISRFNTELLSLQAAQKSFAKVQGLSLFNYL
jgi:flagellar hook-associated protein 3 FlgL